VVIESTYEVPAAGHQQVSARAEFLAPSILLKDMRFRGGATVLLRTVSHRLDSVQLSNIAV
jgi:hypothetical protein